MMSSSGVRLLAAGLCVLLFVETLVQAAPATYSDYDNLRDLYEMLLRNEARAGHQMERKGGRSPSLRLRFGRRADPSMWQQTQPLYDDSAINPASASIAADAK